MASNGYAFQHFYAYFCKGLLEKIIGLHLSSDQTQSQKMVVTELIASILHDSGLFNNLYEAGLWIRLMDITNLNFFMQVLQKAYQHVGDSKDKELTGTYSNSFELMWLEYLSTISISALEETFNLKISEDADMNTATYLFRVFISILNVAPMSRYKKLMEQLHRLEKQKQTDHKNDVLNWLFNYEINTSKLKGQPKLEKAETQQELLNSLTKSTPENVYENLESICKKCYTQFKTLHPILLYLYQISNHSIFDQKKILKSLEG